ncbi:hypothetical protein B0H13DRAFT_1931915, partial [Mycena leptocephala]
MPETYSLLSQSEASPYSFLSDPRPVQSADQLAWKPKQFQKANLYVTVTGGSRGLKTETASTLPPQWSFESKFWTDSRSTELTIKLFHGRRLLKDKLLGECKHTIEDLLQPAAAEQALAVDLKLGKEHMGKLWVRLTLDPGNNELATPASTRAVTTDREAATPASTHAAPTSSDTHSDDAQDQWKKVICEKAKHTWQGLDWIMKTIAPIVPEPFKGPLELFNTISDVAALSARLVEVNSLLLESDSYNIDITESSQQLARLVVAEAHKMDSIQKSHPVKKIPQLGDIAGQIIACLDRLNQGTDDHHRRMTQAIARDIEKNLEFAVASMLPSYAPKALFDADTTAVGLSRRACTPRSRVSIIPTIVRQLIPVYTRYAHAIRNVHPDDVVPASDRHIDELLIHHEIEGGQGARLIEHLIKSLSSSGKTFGGLKFLVTSRPHPDIAELCRPLQESSVYHLEYIEPEKAKEDVRLYVRAELQFLRAQDQ